MVALPQKMRMTEAEYLEFERKSESKHEFIDGEVFEVSGTTLLATEHVLKEIWDTPEEDEAWSHL